MSQPREQRHIRVFAIGYDATIKDATDQEPDRVTHGTGTVNVEDDDLESAVKRAKKVVTRIYSERSQEVVTVAITGATVLADVMVDD